MPLIPMRELIDFGERLLVARGVPAANARFLAETAVQAEAFGVNTHGLVQLGAMDSQIGKTIDPKAEPKIVRQKGATALIDGAGTFGQLAMRLARELATKKAREHGCAAIGVGNTSWIAALGVYLIPLAREGFLAQVYAQSSQCQDSAPFGGIDPRLSTNPMALAFPTDGDPMVADFSTSAVAMGKVGRMVRTGQKARYPIFMDNQGRITNDPTVVMGTDGKMQGGSILPIGGVSEGHKGYALSLWCEAVTILAGGSGNNPKAPQRQSFNLVVIDVEAFAGGDYYRNEMNRFVEWLKTSRVREGFDKIRLPGERGFDLLRQAEKQGVPVDEERLEQLNKLAEKRGVPGLLVPR